MDCPCPSARKAVIAFIRNMIFDTIKWLMARQAEGLSISRAVDLWNEHIASGLDPLAGFAPSAFTSAQRLLPFTSHPIQP